MTDPVRGTRETYDGLAEVFHQSNAEPFAELLDDLAAFCSALPTRAVVADVGCGPGRDVRLLRERGFRVVGLDLSSGMLAAGGLPGLAVADMRALPLSTGSLAGVWCQAALLHVPRDGVPAVLAEFARIRRPGGGLHLAVSEGDGEGWESGHYGSRSARWFVHHRLDDLTGLLATHGLDVERVARSRSGRHWLRVLTRRR